ncbi:O-antigen ligase [Pseudozobellia sp. WGM2]|uniref:O-antigen ligase family protein n=1 Tax=Pseudozobellia sp. WGM2 TaxID=2787625 RepID=UPI001ADF50F2|nr:O-antigen ligase family protein [Pseudozobellia sp. WGM2]
MSELDFNKLHYYGALLYVFLAPFHQVVATVAMVLWALLSLVTFNKKESQRNKYLFILPILYLSYGVGIFYAESSSVHFLEHKLSFLIFPLIFFLHPYSEEKRNKVLKFFVYGLVVSSSVCLGVALFRSIGLENGEIYFRANVEENKAFMESILYGGNYFFGRYFSLFHQTVYFALYLSIGITILLFHPTLLKNKIRLILIGFFLTLIFLVSNKASFIALGLIFIVRLITSRYALKKKLLGFLLFLFIMSLFISINPRARESLYKVAAGELVLNKDARYGFATRLLSWDASLELIKANPILGYGAGDAQSILNQMYAEKEYIHPLKESYNAHNQWLQIWLENGILGLLILFTIILLLFNIAFNGGQNLGFFLSIVLVLCINSMFESVFNRFSGISFVSFLICFFFTYNASKRKNIES